METALKHSSVRRRLVKGSLSAPLVMTVTSVNARTSFTACLSNEATQPKPYKVLAPRYGSQDDYLRVSIDIYKVRLPSQGTLVEQDGLYFIGPDRRTFFKLASHNPESTPATIVTNFNANTPGLQRSIVDRRNALAFVRDDGEIVGFGWQDNGGKHCKKSCYSSVIAQAGRRRWL